MFEYQLYAIIVLDAGNVTVTRTDLVYALIYFYGEADYLSNPPKQ